MLALVCTIGIVFIIWLLYLLTFLLSRHHRTIKEFEIKNRNPDEVKNHIKDWLISNGFTINELSSKGKRISVRGLYKLMGSFIKPHPGSMVASQLEFPSGCIVFEISLTSINTGTLFHGEFYAPTPEFFIVPMEFNLRPKTFYLDKYARQGGYLVMENLLKNTLSYVHS